MPTPLPEPDAQQSAHSARLRALIAEDIRRAGGAIPFSRYMELCLYAPGLGYYSAGATKFGAAGDFVTAPELGPLFAEVVAAAVAPVIAPLADATVLELGGGSGTFAEVALQRLDALGAVPARYAILEPSAELRERQRQRLAALPARLAARVHWLDGPIETPWRGLLFANEVLDALPTTRFTLRDGEVFEEGVTLDRDGALARTERPADPLVAGAVRHLERDLGQPFADGYRSELLPQLPYWLRAVAGGLEHGLVLFVDYGYVRREFYLPERSDGTLVCHYRHRAHGDPLCLQGLQDLTAFVDFTALAEAGVAAGFDLAGYCSQAMFLLGNGLEQRVADAQALPDLERHRRMNEVRRLTLPGEMGERFQVMGLARGVDASALFPLGDQRHRL